MWQIIAGALGWTVFAIPVFEGVLNFGNITGMLLFGCLFFWGIFRKKIRLFLEKKRKKTPFRLLTNVFCVLFLMGAIYSAVGLGLVIHGMTNTPPDGTKIAVVLGCQVNPDCSPSKTLRMRLDRTAEFLNENPDAVCIVTGGQGPDEPISEAQCMKKYLTEIGIPEERIITEDKSTSTKENLVFSAQIINERFTDGTTEIAIATSDYHCYRAGIAAGKAGLKAYSLPAGSPREMLPTYVVREIFGIIGEAFFR